jgi:hypothetical protein
MRDERGKTDLSSCDLTDGPTRRASSAWVQPFFSLARIKLRASRNSGPSFSYSVRTFRFLRSFSLCCRKFHALTKLFQSLAPD